MSGNGKGVLVTGGAARIGKAIAVAFANAGWRVAIHYRQSRAKALALAKALAGGGHCAFHADFLEEGACARLMSELQAAGFPLRCLVNSAAIYRRMALAETDCPAAKEMYQVNFFAPFELMRLFRKNVDSGVVVNLLDQRVALVDPDASVYNFSKKSLRDATEACALAWAPEIRVNGIAPGVVLPPAGGSMEKMRRILRRVPMGRRTTEEEIASAALWLAEGWMTGNILYLDGGLHLTAPAESALPSG